MAEHSGGMKVSSLNIAQVKAKYGIIERENYNKAKWMLRLVTQYYRVCQVKCVNYFYFLWRPVKRPPYLH